MKIRATFDGASLVYVLEDNPSARDLLSLLPLDDRTIDNCTRSKGLIGLGRIEGSFDPLLVRGEFPLRVERMS
jgi:hypothetical protein